MRSVAALARRPARERTGLFLAEGPQPVREALTHQPERVRDLYLTDAAWDRHTEIVAAAHAALAAGHRLRVHPVTEAVLAAMADAQTPQGLLAVCRVPTVALEALLAVRPRLVCVLADVRDPGNAGTVLRGADAAGADLVVLAGDSVDVHSPKVVRSSAGSIFHLPVVTVPSVEDALAALRQAGLAVLAADARASTPLEGADLRHPHAWLLGNEAHGLPADLVGRCDEAIRVPIHGRAESLNLAMAATLCLYASAAAQRGDAR